jgi:hypothetical protein
MSKVTIRIPMIASGGPLQPSQISRDFQGMMPEVESVSFVARIIRDGLETAHFPEYRKLIALSDDYLVEQVALVKAVPDDIWIRNGLVPLGEWEPAR